MIVDTLYLEKETGTLSDDLAVFGLAELAGYLASTRQNAGQAVRWEVLDEGPYFRINVRPGIDLSHLPDRPPALAQGIDNGNARVKEQELQGIPRIFELAKEWEQLRVWAAQQKERQTQKTGAELAIWEPSTFFEVADFIGWRLLQFRSSYHDLLRRWHTLGEAFRITAQVIVEACGQPPGPLSAAGPRWTAMLKQAGQEPGKVDATRLQALNPAQGKGLNRPKPTAVAVGNESGFWVLEYLKAAGLNKVAVPRRVRTAGGQQTDTRKLYVPAPAHIRSDVLETVIERFRRALRDDRPVKLDILAALQLARAMLETQREARPSNEPWALEPIGTLVSGLHTVTFQSLGQAAAVMNIGFLDMPSWLQFAEGTDIALCIALVDEHLGVIRGIDEEGDGFELLRSYREFVTTGLWDPFLTFCGGYGEYLVRNVARNKRYLRRFTTHNLEVLMQREANFTVIVRNPGFRALATAIRLSTIVPQYRQHMGNGDSLYEVRYGLAQDFIRQSLDNEKFIAKLSEFVQSYNAENARVYERHKEQRRRNIEVSELDQVIELIDTYGAPLIARLLVAYGYARDPREPEVLQQDSSEVTPEPSRGESA